MKAKRKSKTDTTRVQEISDITYGSAAEAEPETGMVRTQIYLTAREHAFLQREAAHTGATMAGLIRRFIDEKMELPEDAWANNPLLDPPASDPAWVGHEDSSINHDHYIYGAPKRYKKTRGKWVEQPLSEK